MEKIAACSRIDQTLERTPARLRTAQIVVYYELDEMSAGDQEAYMKLVKQARTIAERARAERGPLITMG